MEAWLVEPQDKARIGELLDPYRDRPFGALDRMLNADRDDSIEERILTMMVCAVRNHWVRPQRVWLGVYAFSRVIQRLAAKIETVWARDGAGGPLYADRTFITLLTVGGPVEIACDPDSDDQARCE